MERGHLTRPERVAREMLLAGASGRRGWRTEAEDKRLRRKVRHAAATALEAAGLLALLGWLLWAAAHGLDSEGEGWAVGDYVTAAAWQDGGDR